MLRRPAPDPVRPGQESVWAYPRPPALRLSREPISIVLGGRTICWTDTSWQVLETSHPPTYYLPRSAFVADASASAPKPSSSVKLVLLGEAAVGKVHHAHRPHCSLT